MAKNKKNNYSDILKKLQGIVPETDSMASDKFKVREYVSTGSYLLNAQITGSIYKGIPEGRMIMFAGEEGTGKTFLALNAAREAQRQHNSKILWIDTEKAVDTETMERMGIDIDNVVYTNPGTISQVSTLITNLLDSIDGEEPIEWMIVLDSIGNLSSDKEVTDIRDGQDKVDMTKQKKLKAMFRVILNKLGTKRVPMVAITHVYDEIGSFYNKKNVSGGSGAKYGASITLMLFKAQLKKADDIYAKDKAGDDIKKTGITIRCVQEKTRYTVGGIDIRLRVSFYKGMNKYMGLAKYLDWDNCGVAPGKLKEIKDGEIEFSPHAGSSKPRTYAIKKLKKNVKRKEIYRYAKYVFTDDNLEVIDNKLKEKFELPDYSEDFDEYDGLLEEETEDSKETEEKE